MKAFLSIVVAVTLMFTLIPTVDVSGQITTTKEIQQSAVIASPAMTIIETQAPTVVGADRKDYVRHFSLVTIPPAPKLTLEFSALQKGICPVTYKHTEIWLNRKLVQQIDFRKIVIGVNQSFTVSIPHKALKIGENLLEISFGSCQYGIDVMRLDTLRIAAN